MGMWREMEEMAVEGIRRTGFRVRSQVVLTHRFGWAIKSTTLPGYFLVVFDGESVVCVESSNTIVDPRARYMGMWREMEEMAVEGIRRTGFRVRSQVVLTHRFGWAIKSTTLPGYFLVVFDGESVVCVESSNTIVASHES